MSNARDKANIPALNFSSTGIDDNATSTAITIDSSGKAVIGKTTVDSEISKLQLFGTSPGTGSGGQLGLQGSETTGAINTGGGIAFKGHNGSGNRNFGDLKCVKENSTVGNNLSFMSFATRNTSGVGERMRIDSSGNVGIGTSSPVSDAKLTISSDDTESNIFFERSGSTRFDTAIANSFGNIVFKGGANSSTVSGLNEFMRIVGDNGRVGIGTSSPSGNLEVRGSASDTSQLYISTSTKPNSRIGYIGLNRFGMDIYDGLQVRDISASYATRFVIDSSGNVGIGTSSPDDKLHVTDSSNAELKLQTDNANGGSAIKFNRSGTDYSYIGTKGYFTGTSDNNLYLRANSGLGVHFYTNGNNERMRIDTSGNVLVGKTSQSNSTAGVELQPSGLLLATRADAPMLLNRINSDGIIVYLQQNNTTEGTISVSGATVSYNGFTGTHWSRFTDNSTPNILRGTVLETLDEMCDWYNLEFDIITTTQDEDGNDVETVRTKKIPHVLADGQSNGDVITYNHEGTDYQATIVKETDVKHMKSKVSDTVDAKNVYGVFSAYDLDGEGYNDFYVASVGSFVVRIKANETIAKGDLLQSNGDGTAKVQTDDNIKSSSFAKVLSTTIIETYEDGSYLVPCSLMC